MFPQLPVTVMKTKNSMCQRDSDLYVEHLNNFTLWAYESRSYFFYIIKLINIKFQLNSRIKFNIKEKKCFDVFEHFRLFTMIICQFEKKNSNVNSKERNLYLIFPFNRIFLL